MGILENIYEAYIAGNLKIKPEAHITQLHEKADVLEEEYDLTEEQILELEEYIIDTAARYGKSMFFAGFKIAAALMNELFANPNRKS